MKDENVLKIRKVAEKILRELDPSCSLHDFRIVHGTRQIVLYSIWSFPSIMMRREETSFRC